MAENDSITDLTQDDSADGNMKGKQGTGAKPAEGAKAPKAPKPQKPQAAPAAAPLPEAGAKRKKKKKKKKGKLKIILILLLVVLAVGFVTEEIIINFFGVRDMFIDAVISLDPEYADREQDYIKREEELDAKEKELNRREQSVLSRENANERRRIELDLREEEVAEREESALPLWSRLMSEQELADMQALSRSYALMAPEAAAAILMELDSPQDVAAILYHMSERSRASILTAMESEFAALLTEILLYK